MNRPRYPCQARGSMDWRALCEQHKPTDPHALAREVRRLHADHMTALDIAEALGLALPQVLEMLQGPGRD